MDLLVAYDKDPAGNNMAKFLIKNMKKEGNVFRGKNFDLTIISSPSISADWLEEEFSYDGFVFLSKHAAESGVLALTCHSTGNFSEAKFGGKACQLAIPYPSLQKSYLQTLSKNKNSFSQFQITLEATHHGPTNLNKPCLFMEIGTTEKQWNDVGLCNSIAKIVSDVFSQKKVNFPVGICFGGTHYPSKFNDEIINGKFSLGTVMPKHALEYLNEKLFDHILSRNKSATAALLDWTGLGPHKNKVLELLKTTNLKVIKL